MEQTRLVVDFEKLVVVLMFLSKNLEQKVVGELMWLCLAKRKVRVIVKVKRKKSNLMRVWK